MKLLKPVREAIEAIPEHAWVTIKYWLDGGADVAETTHTAFKGTKDERELRLIVRRVGPTPGSQLTLVTTYDYHPFVTDSASLGRRPAQPADLSALLPPTAQSACQRLTLWRDTPVWANS